MFLGEKKMTPYGRTIALAHAAEVIKAEIKREREACCEIINAQCGHDNAAAPAIEAIRMRD